jgi:hypothetical protein
MALTYSCPPYNCEFPANKLFRLMIKLLFLKGTGFSPYIYPAKSAGL